MAKRVKCPECRIPMQSQTGRFGLFFACPNFPECDITQPADKDGTPRGAPANRETRRARKSAHAAFDPLWRDVEHLVPSHLQGRARWNELAHQRRAARRRAYAWLCNRLALSHIDECHIALFDWATCQRVIELCLDENADAILAWALRHKHYQPRQCKQHQKRRK